jgi:hypothetical protein
VLLTSLGDPGELAEPAAEFWRRSRLGVGVNFDPVAPEIARRALGPAAEPLGAAP